MRRTVARFLISVGLAVIICAALGIMSVQPGKRWFYDLLSPAWAAGTMVSGNVHQPNVMVASIVVFLMSFAVAYLAVVLWDTIVRRVR